MTVPKVLIVDDSKTMRFQAKAMLPDETQIFEAEDGIQGIQKILKLRPDLILLDCFMPRMNGWQVINRMLSYPEVSHLPVVLITGYKKELDESAPQLFDYFIYDYFELLGKPFEQASLFIAIRKAVEKAKKRHPHQTFFDTQFLTQPELFLPHPQSLSATLTPDLSQSGDPFGNQSGNQPGDQSENTSWVTPIKLAPSQSDQLPFNIVSANANINAVDAVNAKAVNDETRRLAELRQQRNQRSPQQVSENSTAMQLQLLQAEVRTLRQRNDILMQEVNRLKQQVGQLLEKP